jgi:hypothetical protein
MKNILLISTILSSSLVFSNVTFADQSKEIKNWNVGAGIQSLTVTNDDENSDFGGNILTVSYAFSDSLAVRGSIHSLEHDEYSELTSDSYDIIGYWGSGLQSEGFKAYIGAGLFSDTWEVDGYQEDENFSGVVFSGGLGYSWEYITVDLILGARQAKDYADLVEKSGSTGIIMAITTSLVLSARF